MKKNDTKICCNTEKEDDTEICCNTEKEDDTYMYCNTDKKYTRRNALLNLVTKIGLLATSFPGLHNNLFIIFM